MSAFTAACLQTADLGPDLASRRAAAVALVEEQRGADLVVLPELWPTGYFSFDAYEQTAEALDGPTVEALAGAAREIGAYVALGSLIERRGTALHNTSVLLDPAGVVAAVYRKMHVFGYGSRETELISGGTEVVTVSTELGVLGLAVCYDLRFPELFRAMTDAGAEIFVVPAAWPQARVEHWRLLARARAIENQAYVIAVNGAGTLEQVELGGHSGVIGPYGEIEAEAGGGAEVLSATVDRRRVAACREDFPALADRRLTTRNT